MLDPGIGPVPGKVPNCPFLTVKSSGASNWAASTEVSNRGYKCVLASPNASRCLPTSNPNCLRSRLLDLATWRASSSVSTVAPFVCPTANWNWQSAATNTQVIVDRRACLTALLLSVASRLPNIGPLMHAEAFSSFLAGVLLTPASSSRDPLADVCWAILELDVAGFAAR